MASYSQYEEMKTDHDRTREGAISSPSPEGACAASVGPSSTISNQPRRTPTGGREKFNARTETGEQYVYRSVLIVVVRFIYT